MDAERTALLSQLVRKLNRQQSDALLERSAAYRAGTLGHSDFYTYLKTLCANNKIDLVHYPSMDAYIRYVLLADSLDVDTIVRETSALEKDAFAMLAKNEAERNLIAASRRLYLTDKLLDFALTKEEWEEYKAIPKQRDLAFPSE